ncbi:Vacuolar protein sorting-associated protein 74 [Mycena venus]|uniref:Vacuolar protein sorting-associated protein 74 n=1 Tax=Mycena venus TaxID=2733690 RepID=A0A8H6YR71_9AGAR|nr:Vacuolar protein sorting-associated protein 74 [Mycena venus]
MASVVHSDDGPTPSPPPSGTNDGKSRPPGGLEGGARATADPRDSKLEMAEEGRREDKLPRLTLAEEVLLLGIQDKKGYLSFWNDDVSYALRACILMELALQRRIGILYNPQPTPLEQRMVTVLSTLPTGDPLLDEALMMIKKTEDAGERMNTRTWVDYLSGETWNFRKVPFQLKQVRERICEGLVQKGVLGTGTRNFFIFDMITHPVIDTNSKTRIISRLNALLITSTSTVVSAATALVEEGTQCALLRTVCLAGAAYKGRVMDSVFAPLLAQAYTARMLCDEILREFGAWPFGRTEGAQERVRWLVGRAREESTDGEKDRAFELVAAVLEMLSKL